MLRKSLHVLPEFNPESFAELVKVVSGQRNAAFRMVLGYWGGFTGHHWCY